MPKEEKCTTVDNMVTGICIELDMTNRNGEKCSEGDAAMMKITPVPANVTSISGTLSV
ncbi:hypothetical protein KIN20_037471 [Parelaphostrongylus tenuis]|uniref:Uncharacterized protein n=1 Tax=Parelaphostrongylus tenuis TaxID=148309 RepID=A0AAD5WM46_PARTN|nr:hypothetical protein KIN20_037471 [Parelaphostrongylus tenuis]